MTVNSAITPPRWMSGPSADSGPAKLSGNASLKLSGESCGVLARHSTVASPHRIRPAYAVHSSRPEVTSSDGEPPLGRRRVLERPSATEPPLTVTVDSLMREHRDVGGVRCPWKRTRCSCKKVQGPAFRSSQTSTTPYYGGQMNDRQRCFAGRARRCHHCTHAR